MDAWRRQPSHAAPDPAADGLLLHAVAVATALFGALLLVGLLLAPGSLAVRAAPTPLVEAGSSPSEDRDPAADHDPAAGQGAPPRTDPSVPASRDGDLASAEAAVVELLASRDTAVRTGNPTGWARTDDPAIAGDPDQATATDQSAVADAFTVLSSLPLTRFESSLVADTLEPADGDSAAIRGAWQAQVRTVYQFADGPAVVRADTVVLDRAGTSGWRAGGWEPYPALGQIGTAAPWDLGPVTAIVSERAVVLAWDGAEPDGWAEQVSGWADSGAAVVDSYLGSGWPRVSLVLAPATAAQYAALTPGPRPAVDDVFAAVTVDVITESEPSDGGGGSGVGDLVILNPAARGDLTADTWQVTVTHELVHVASGSLFGDSQEIWLAEGVADLIGWSTQVPSRVSREVVAGRLLQRVDDGDADLSSLPDRDDFTDVDPDVVGDAYEGAWLAALLLQDEIGTEGVIEVYTSASADAGEPVERTDAALGDATGEGRDAFEARWAAYVRSLAAG